MRTLGYAVSPYRGAGIVLFSAFGWLVRLVS
jgi:hypothetical protein